MAIYCGLSHWTWLSSKLMLNYQRVAYTASWEFCTYKLTDPPTKTQTQRNSFHEGFNQYVCMFILLWLQTPESFIRHSVIVSVCQYCGMCVIQHYIPLLLLSPSLLLWCAWNNNKPFLSHHHFYRWCSVNFPFPVMGSIWHRFTHINHHETII